MRVLTWNVWGIGPDVEARSQRLIEYLRAEDADLMAFQEVVLNDDGSSFLDRYADEIDGTVVYGPGPDGFESPMRNAIVSKYPVRRSASQLLSSGHDVRFRSVVMADVEVGGGRMRFHTTHLDHRLHDSQLRQSQLVEVISFIQANEPEDATHAPVLAGDLNARPGSDEVRALTGSAPPLVDSGIPRVFIDVWHAVGEGSGDTWSSGNELITDPQSPNRRLDYVMVGYPVPKGCGRPRSAWLAGTKTPCSDHYALVVDLS